MYSNADDAINNAHHINRNSNADGASNNAYHINSDNRNRQDNLNENWNPSSLLDIIDIYNHGKEVGDKSEDEIENDIEYKNKNQSEQDDGKNSLKRRSK
eukprot:Awhi_evm2s11144